MPRFRIEAVGKISVRTMMVIEEESLEHAVTLASKEVAENRNMRWSYIQPPADRGSRNAPDNDGPVRYKIFSSHGNTLLGEMLEEGTCCGTDSSTESDCDDFE